MPRRSSLHRAYLEVLLEREVGSTYSAPEEGEFEGRCMELSVEELVREQPGEDLRILAARLTQVHSS